jgi:hypothetical protein
MNRETKHRQHLAAQLRTLALQVLDHNHALPDLLTVEVLIDDEDVEHDTLTEAHDEIDNALREGYPRDAVQIRVSFSLEADHASD